jgi:prepilin-type processing-associated H-X9-DG protein
VDELNYSKTGPLPSFGKTAYAGGTNVAMADGSVRFMKNTLDEKTIRNLIERNDGNVVTLDW